ncbi:MAG: hypothetical protein DRN96_02395 [Thermoproteota archaeon]|nr:MAG: hypothetical protein DRN96_02395 [Candidatus Korarchaeota archaeon]
MKARRPLSLQVMFLAGVPGIHWAYTPSLRKLYGGADIFEVYGAAEGSFASQLTLEPGLAPMYDFYVLEVEAGGKTKMLHELKAGQSGCLIASTPLAPRYRMGDVVLCLKDGVLFRVVGRKRVRTRVLMAAEKVARALSALF